MVLDLRLVKIGCRETINFFVPMLGVFPQCLFVLYVITMANSAAPLREHVRLYMHYYY